MRTWIGLGLACLAACSGDRATQAGVEVTSAADGAGDTTAEASAETSVATVADTTAEAIAETTAETSVATVADTTAEVIAETTSTDAPDASWPSDRPEGQCARNADCPGVLMCAETAPGGICNGCADGPCPSGTACNAFGACSRDCASDDECPAGMRCSSVQAICALVSCSDDGDCTAPYVCDGGYCRRPPCANATCPAPFVCVGESCVEPYFAP